MVKNWMLMILYERHEACYKSVGICLWLFCIELPNKFQPNIVSTKHVKNTCPNHSIAIITKRDEHISEL